MSNIQKRDLLKEILLTFTNAINLRDIKQEAYDEIRGSLIDIEHFSHAKNDVLILFVYNLTIAAYKNEKIDFSEFMNMVKAALDEQLKQN